MPVEWQLVFQYVKEPISIIKYGYIPVGIVIRGTHIGFNRIWPFYSFPNSVDLEPGFYHFIYWNGQTG